MAVAVHLGKVDCMSYRHKNFNVMDWKYYLSWQTLKDHPSFLPPKPQTPIELEEEEVVIEANGSNNDASTTVSGLDNDDSVQVTQPTPSMAKSRGPGSGNKKTKLKAVEDEYRKKKCKIQEGLLEVQQKRTQEFAAYVSNQARAQAFKMAKDGYITFKDDDPEEAAKYKAMMENILTKNTVADEDTGSDGGQEGEMPALTGQFFQLKCLQSHDAMQAGNPFLLFTAAIAERSILVGHLFRYLLPNLSTMSLANCLQRTLRVDSPTCKFSSSLSKASP